MLKAIMSTLDLIMFVAMLRDPTPICATRQETFRVKLEPPVAQARLIIAMNFGRQQRPR